MNWDYNVEVSVSNDPRVPPEIKITKTLYDESNNVVVKVDTTAEDARDNAGPEFLQEYFDLAKITYASEIERIFTYTSENGIPISGPSYITILSARMHGTMAQGMFMMRGNVI